MGAIKFLCIKFGFCKPKKAGSVTYYLNGSLLHMWMKLCKRAKEDAKSKALRSIIVIGFSIQIQIETIILRL